MNNGSNIDHIDLGGGRGEGYTIRTIHCQSPNLPTDVAPGTVGCSDLGENKGPTFNGKLSGGVSKCAVPGEGGKWGLNKGTEDMKKIRRQRCSILVCHYNNFPGADKKSKETKVPPLAGIINCLSPDPGGGEGGAICTIPCRPRFRTYLSSGLPGCNQIQPNSNKFKQIQIQFRFSPTRWCGLFHGNRETAHRCCKAN